MLPVFIFFISGDRGIASSSIISRSLLLTPSPLPHVQHACLNRPSIRQLKPLKIQFNFSEDKFYYTFQIPVSVHQSSQSPPITDQNHECEDPLRIICYMECNQMPRFGKDFSLIEKFHKIYQPKCKHEKEQFRKNIQSEKIT